MFYPMPPLFDELLHPIWTSGKTGGRDKLNSWFFRPLLKPSTSSLIDSPFRADTVLRRTTVSRRAGKSGSCPGPDSQPVDALVRSHTRLLVWSLNRLLVGGVASKLAQLLTRGCIPYTRAVSS